jgi:hypothetical protein
MLSSIDWREALVVPPVLRILLEQQVLMFLRPPDAVFAGRSLPNPSSNDVIVDSALYCS